MHRLAFVVGSLWGVFLNAAEPTPLTVTVTGFKHSTGVALCKLFTSRVAFPTRAAQQATMAPIVGNVARCLFAAPPSGAVAIAVAHDENGNGQLDKNFFGVPVEPYGFSRDAMRTFGPPSFDEAAIVSSGQPLTLTVSLRAP